MIHSNKILAIDPGSIQTGYAYRDEDGDEISGVLKVPERAPIPLRLHSIARQLSKLLKTAPDFKLAIIEKPDFLADNKRNMQNKNISKLIRSLFVLSEARGAIILVLAAAGVTVLDMPTKWKGHSNKNHSMAATGKSNHNEADAICMLRWFEAIGHRMPEFKKTIEQAKRR